MASHSSSFAAMGATLLVYCAALTSATVHIVGESSGWTTGVDFSSWTSGKTFVVGDILAFNYAPAAHTVNEVKAKGYKTCSANNYLSTDSGGSTSIRLRTAGTHYFICSVPGHCGAGMKLAVTVVNSPSSSPAASPSPSSFPSPPPSASAAIDTRAPTSVSSSFSRSDKPDTTAGGHRYEHSSVVGSLLMGLLIGVIM